MVTKPFAAEDPLKLTAVCCPGADQEAQFEILVEEYCRMGTSREQILAMFRDPFYGLLHRYHLQAGADAVERLVDRVAAKWGTFRYTSQFKGERKCHG